MKIVLVTTIIATTLRPLFEIKITKIKYPSPRKFKNPLATDLDHRARLKGGKEQHEGQTEQDDVVKLDIHKAAAAGSLAGFASGPAAEKKRSIRVLLVGHRNPRFSALYDRIKRFSQREFKHFDCAVVVF